MPCERGTNDTLGWGRAPLSRLGRRKCILDRTRRPRLDLQRHTCAPEGLERGALRQRLRDVGTARQEPVARRGRAPEDALEAARAPVLDGRLELGWRGSCQPLAPVVEAELADGRAIE